MKILRHWKHTAKQLQKLEFAEANELLGNVLLELIVCFSESSELRPLQLKARACTLNQIWMQCAVCVARIVDGELVEADRYMFASVLIDYCDSYEIADELLKAMQLPNDYAALHRANEEAYMIYGKTLHAHNMQQLQTKLKRKTLGAISLKVQGEISLRAANQYIDLALHSHKLLISDRFAEWAVEVTAESHSLVFAFIPPDILEQLLCTGFCMYDTNSSNLKDILRAVGYGD